MGKARRNDEPRPVESARALSEDDRRRLDDVDRVLSEARELRKWWLEADRRHRESGGEEGYGETFRLSATHNRPDSSYGFFAETTVGGKKTPIMGNVQEQFFDRPKAPAAAPGLERSSVDWTRRQVREFVLRYFLRISDFSSPRAFPDDRSDPPPAFLRPFSFCPDGEAETHGFGFELAYYKKPGGEPGKFAEEKKYAIVDLREIGEAKTYEWIVVKVEIFDFAFHLAPFGRAHPYGTVPLGEESYLVIAADFVSDETVKNPQDGLVGRYGLGYGFLRDLGDSVLGYGPGRFDAGFQTIDFHVKDDGEIRTRMAFVANRPRKLTDVSFDPVKWGLRLTEMFSFGMLSGMVDPMRSAYRRMPQLPGFDLGELAIEAANFFSAGAAERQLCVSKKQLEKIFLVQHFAQHYNVIAGALVTWRQIGDWLAGEELPKWVKTGESS